MSQMPHWSATRFSLFEQCPQLFKAHYVDGEAMEVTEAMAFGSAVHHGLEAHYQGQDGVRAFRDMWKGYPTENRGLTAVGLDLLEQTFALKLEGIPERGFSIDTESELGAPIVGAIDLWGADGVIYDFKTTRGAWSQERAQREQWQPILYTWARWNDEPEYAAAFEYIVLDRVRGTLSRFRREWTPLEWLEQINGLWTRMQRISVDVAQNRYVCSGDHPNCPECGAKWEHGHECEPQTQRRIRRRA
jgi:hypothetical protein